MLDLFGLSHVFFPCLLLCSDQPPRLNQQCSISFIIGPESAHPSLFVLLPSSTVLILSFVLQVLIHSFFVCVCVCVSLRGKVCLPHYTVTVLAHRLSCASGGKLFFSFLLPLLPTWTDNSTVFSLAFFPCPPHNSVN